jgi:DNA modification methylase/ParB-like chromosome segregation protein Spo0J
MIQPRTEQLDPASLKLPASFVPNEERLNDLVSSIRDRGLFHAPCVKDNGEVFAGKVRVIACIKLKIEHIECHIYPSDLDPDDYIEIALHENLKRANLSWDEQVLAERELHELRIDQNGKGKTGKKVGWSLRDTAQELQMSFGSLSEDLRMAEAIIHNPSLKRIKDKGTAKRIILDQLRRSNQELDATAPCKIEANVCLHGGSEVILQQYPDRTFDACITDPPWLEYKDQSLVRDEFTLPVFKEIFRVLKANSFLMAFVSTQDWIYYFDKLQKLGFSVQKYPIIWVKEGVLSYGCLSWQYQRDYEPILIAVKGSPALTSNMLSSIISCKVVPSAHLVHPNEKPKEVIKRLIDHCTYADALILDPFAGSFVVPVTATEMGRRYVAIENNDDYYLKGVERLKNAKTKIA